MIVLVIALILIFLVIFWYISTGNHLQALTANLDAEEAKIDTLLTHRSDLLTQLLDLCRNCPACATDDLPFLPTLHSGMPMAERNQADIQLGALTRRLHTMAKAHAALASNRRYRELQLDIRDLEEQLQPVRSRYNDAASTYNRLLSRFPSQAVGRHLRLTPRALFQPDPPSGGFKAETQQKAS